MLINKNQHPTYRSLIPSRELQVANRTHAQRMYQTAMLGLYAMTAQLEMFVYQAQTEALAHGITIEDEDLAYLVRYYDRFRLNIDRTITMSEDVMNDYRYSYQRAGKSHRQRFLLEVGYQMNGVGAKHPASVAPLSAILLITELMRAQWGVVATPLRRLHRVPRYVDDALLILALVDKKAASLAERMEPVLSDVHIRASKEAEQVMLELMEMCYDPEHQNEACWECMAENDALPEKYKGMTREEIENGEDSKT